MATKGWDKCSNTCQFCRWWSARFFRGGNKNTKYTKTYENWIISKLRMGVCHMSQIDWDLLIWTFPLSILSFKFSWAKQSDDWSIRFTKKKPPSSEASEVPFLPWFHLGNSRGDVYTCSGCLFFRLHLYSDTYFQKVNNHNQNTWFSNIHIHIHGMCVSCCVLSNLFRGFPCATKWDSRSFQASIGSMLENSTAKLSCGGGMFQLKFRYHIPNTTLVGGFNPFEKYESNWIISPHRGEHE